MIYLGKKNRGGHHKSGSSSSSSSSSLLGGGRSNHENKQDQRVRKLIAKHPLQVQVTVSSEGGNSVLLLFSHLHILQIVAVNVSINRSKEGKSIQGDKEVINRLRTEMSVTANNFDREKIGRKKVSGEKNGGIFFAGFSSFKF